jgi:hypothetical protein
MARLAPTKMERQANIDEHELLACGRAVGRETESGRKGARQRRQGDAGGAERQRGDGGDGQQHRPADDQLRWTQPLHALGTLRSQRQSVIGHSDELARF